MIGLYSDSGAEDACVIASEHMFKWMGCEVRRIYATTIHDGVMDDIDIFYFPGGNMFRYIDGISDQGKARIRQQSWPT